MSEKKKEESYDEQVMREFEQTQGVQDTQEEKTDVVKEIGKVDLNRGAVNLDDDPNIQRINSFIGFHDVPLDSLPSQGRYMPQNTIIRIRAARVGEIREFSTMDETDKKDIVDKLTYIISQCVKVYYGNVPGSYKDIIAEDRIVLLIKIRELTFTDGATSIRIPVPDNACSTAGCHPQKTVAFCSNDIVFKTPSPELEKYYDDVNRCYNIQTKRFGTITIYPPTIGVTTAIIDWVAKQQSENKKFEVTLTEILQFLIKDWRGLSDKMIFGKLSELTGWSTEKFSLVYRLVEKISVGIEYTISTTCETCGGEIKVPITFPEGYKSLFIPTISDLGDELL